MKRVLLSILLATLITGCQQASTTKSGAVGADRKQMMLLSSQEVDQMAAQAYASTIQKSTSQGVLLPATDPMTIRVRAIANKLIPHATVFRPEAAQWKWEVNVQKNPQNNAYCMAGGKIMFYSGIITNLKLTDDEIAQVMGHEIAHALREHSRERMSEEYAKTTALSGGLELASLATGGKYDNYKSLTGDTLNKVAELAITLPNSRTHESEADMMGLELAARAGYDPKASVTLWQKMSAQGSGGPEFLSTHPSGTTRIAELQAKIPTVQPLYEAAKLETNKSSKSRKKKKNKT